jgi:tetratricopeptide (TPR) repeat protein
VKMDNYMDAAEAFDEAYQIYAQLVDDDTTRPYRITWYQTWPYWAYYYSGRYQDVVNLADTTLETIADPTLEETLYWRAMANYALGNKALARADFYESVRLNPNFQAGWDRINTWTFE